MKDNRWNLAQIYEKEWWDGHKSGMSMDFYKNFALELDEVLAGILTIDSNSTILEIGSGAAGIITYIESDHKYAIDPLENFYSTIESFAKVRDSRVKYYCMKGEDISFDSEMFDLIIIDNVLDHCEDPLKVLSQINRVLKPGGIVFFRQNTYHFWGVFVRSLMELLTFDKGHPFTFSKKQIVKYFLKYNFEVLKIVRNGYFNTWKNEILSRKKKEVIKALLFATRDKTLYLLRKQ